MKTSDWIIAFATIAGPILAVQAQKYLERWQSRQQRRVEIFYTLMGTRATRIALSHVQALNRIELEFRPRPWIDWIFFRRAAKDKAVIEAWRIYARHLGLDYTPDNLTAWSRDGTSLFFELLHKISLALGFDYPKSELMQGAYHPRGHGEAESLQQELLENAVRVVKGETALAMRVTQFPFEVDPPQKSKDEVILDSIMGTRPGRAG